VSALLLVALLALVGLVLHEGDRHALARERLLRRVAAMRFRFSSSDLITVFADFGSRPRDDDPLLAGLPADVLERVVRVRDRNRVRRFGRDRLAGRRRDVNLPAGGGLPAASHYFWYGWRDRNRAGGSA
jgi:hypothetical protein